MSDRLDSVFTRYGRVDLRERRPDRDIGARPDSRVVGKGVERDKAHDSGVRWLERHERHKVREDGGFVVGRRSEIELNRKLNRDLARLKAYTHRKSTPEERTEIAERYGLPVGENGRIQIPDVQLLIEHPDGRQEVRNLEFVTPNYRDSRSGFTTGSISGSVRGRTYRVVEGPNIVGKIMR